MLVLRSDARTDLVSQWLLVRNPLRTMFNTVVIVLCKFVPWMWLKVFLMRHCLRMRIGRNVGIAPVEFSSLFPELISVGDGSVIGWKATLAGHLLTHRRVILGRVRIGRNALIGALAAVQPGVTIGDGAVVAMHSLVDKDIPPGELWGGVPARFIRRLDDASSPLPPCLRESQD